MIQWTNLLSENKYSKWYESLIDKSIGRILSDKIYTEKHHIIPKCMGGSNKGDNLVKLTAREHYIAHALLWKMDFPKRQHLQMMHAFNAMNNMLYNKRDHKINSRLFESVRLESVAHRKTLVGIFNPNYGKKMTDSTKQRLKEANFKRYIIRLRTYFVGPLRPSRAFEFRGVVYFSRGRASNATGIDSWKIKTEIKYWGHNPDAAQIKKIDSGQLVPPIVAHNKGVPMSKEQKLSISNTKKEKFQSMVAAGIPNPQLGRKLSIETRQKISAKAAGRVISDDTRKKMSSSGKGKKKSKEHVAAIAASRLANKIAKQNVAKVKNT